MIPRRPLDPSAVAKHSIEIGGRETSVSLEEAFWQRLKTIAATRQVTVSDLVTEINRARERRNLSSVLRVFVLEEMTR